MNDRATVVRFPTGAQLSRLKSPERRWGPHYPPIKRVFGVKPPPLQWCSGRGVNIQTHLAQGLRMRGALPPLPI